MYQARPGPLRLIDSPTGDLQEGEGSMPTLTDTSLVNRTETADSGTAT